MLDPQPDDPTPASIYRKEYYDAWGIQRDEDLTRSHETGDLGRLSPTVPYSVSRDSEATRFGAAMGYLMEEAAALGMVPYGAELSEFGATRIAEKFGGNPLFCGPFEQASFVGVDEDFFDIITMIDFIEHVRSPMSILAKASRLLRPGGQLVF